MGGVLEVAGEEWGRVGGSGEWWGELEVVGRSGEGWEGVGKGEECWRSETDRPRRRWERGMEAELAAEGGGACAWLCVCGSGGWARVARAHQKGEVTIPIEPRLAGVVIVVVRFVELTRLIPHTLQRL